MKKILYAVAGLALLASCSTEEVVEVIDNRAAITFSEAYVENATRAIDGSYTMETLRAETDSAFKVYGTLTTAESKVVNIFRGVDVTYNGTEWTYTGNTQYWIEGNNYKFRAIAAKGQNIDVVTDDDGMATQIKVGNISNVNDILLAEENVAYDENTPSNTVGFTFSHLLSKVKFTVKNTVADYYYAVEGITMPTTQKGIYNIANRTWAYDGTQKYNDFIFGNAVAADETDVDAKAVIMGQSETAVSIFENQLIPGDEDRTITFTVKVYKKDAENNYVLIGTEDKEVATSGVELKAGNAYNFVLELGAPGDEIEFTVNGIDPWVQNAEVTTAAELKSALAAASNGSVITLKDDIDLGGEILVVNANNVTIDGNGNTLNSTAPRGINISGAGISTMTRAGEPAGLTVTLKNFTINATGERAINIIEGAHNVTIENVTATADNYTVNVAGSARGSKVAIKNSNLTGLNTVNVAGAGAKVTIEGTTITCDDQNENEKYAALCLHKDAVGASIAATDCTFDIKGDSEKARNGAEGGTLTIDGEDDDVVVAYAYISYGDYHAAYYTLQDAIEAAAAGETITLIRDITLGDEQLTIAENTTVTIDLNGKTIKGTRIHQRANFVNEGTLTIKNGVISSTGKNGGAALINRGTLVAENVTLNGAPYDGEDLYDGVNSWWPSYAFNNEGGGATFTNSRFTSNHGTVASSGADALVTLNNCEIDMAGIEGKTSHGIYAYDNGAVVINGGTYANNYANQGSVGGNVLLAEGGTLTVNAGTFTGRLTGAGLTLKGGTYSVDPTAFVADGYMVEQNADETYTVVVAPGVKTAEALAAAIADGGEVLLGANITLTEMLTIAENTTVTLNLNGKTITGGWNGSSTTNHIYAISNRGTLTIEDKSIEGKGSINSRGIWNYGSLTLNSGKIAAIDGNGGYAVNNESGATFVMNGGWVAADNEDGDAPGAGGDATAIDVPTGATATLNAGKITNAGNYTFAIYVAGELTIPENSTIEVEGRHGAIYISAGEVTIDAGSYSIPENKETTDNVCYVEGTGKLTINGGTFTADNDGPNGGTCVCDTNGRATINGGNFGNSSGGDVWGKVGGTVINGGTFENLGETAHVAEGATIVNGGKTYKKVEGTMVEQ